MNMKEDDKKRDNLERAKIVMGKTDPALLSAVLSEIIMETDEAEEVEVAKVKKAIKGIYDSIPEGKDKKSIISKAFTELDSDIIEKEVKVIKENLASIDKETIMEAAKDYVNIQEIKSCIYSLKSAIACVCGLKYYLFNCQSCVNNVKCICGIGSSGSDIQMCICGIGSSGSNIQSCICGIGSSGSDIQMCICGIGSSGSNIQSCFYGCIYYAIKPPGCSCGIQYEVGIPQKWETDPLIKGQLKEEIIQEVLQRPELSRAMKKMLKKIQDEK
jgi:hypothetical protein